MTPNWACLLIPEGDKEIMDDDFSVIDIEVDRRSEGIQHPVEDGTKIFDNKVILPLTVKLTGIVHLKNFERIWSYILKMYECRTYKFFDVLTKTEELNNLMLTEVPKRETSEKWDAVEITLTFQQVMFTKQETVPKDNRHADTIDTGSLAQAQLNTPTQKLKLANVGGALPVILF